jgi:hypothetical protein
MEQRCPTPQRHCEMLVIACLVIVASFLLRVHADEQVGLAGASEWVLPPLCLSRAGCRRKMQPASEAIKQAFAFALDPHRFFSAHSAGVAQGDADQQNIRLPRLVVWIPRSIDSAIYRHRGPSANHVDGPGRLIPRRAAEYLLNFGERHAELYLRHVLAGDRRPRPEEPHFDAERRQASRQDEQRRALPHGSLPEPSSRAGLRTARVGTSQPGHFGQPGHAACWATGTWATGKCWMTPERPEWHVPGSLVVFLPWVCCSLQTLSLGDDLTQARRTRHEWHRAQ